MCASLTLSLRRGFSLCSPASLKIRAQKARKLTTNANSGWLGHKHSAVRTFVNLRPRNCPHVFSTRGTRFELSGVGLRSALSELLAKLRSPGDNGRQHCHGGRGGPTPHLLTHETNRPCLQTRSRRPRTTIRCECGGRENVQTMPVRLGAHHIARTGFLMLFSLDRPHCHPICTDAAPQIRRPWPDKDPTSSGFRQKNPGAHSPGLLSGPDCHDEMEPSRFARRVYPAGASSL